MSGVSNNVDRQDAREIRQTRIWLIVVLVISAMLFLYCYGQIAKQDLSNRLLLVFAVGAFASAVRGLDSLATIEVDNKYSPRYKWNNRMRPLMGGLFGLLTYALIQGGIIGVEGVVGTPISDPWVYIAPVALLSYHTHLFSKRIEAMASRISPNEESSPDK